MTPDLELVSFDELFAEIAKRCRAMLLVYETPNKIGDDGTVHFSYTGGRMIATGMAATVLADLARPQASDPEDDDGD